METEKKDAQNETRHCEWEIAPNNVNGNNNKKIN